MKKSFITSGLGFLYFSLVYDLWIGPRSLYTLPLRVTGTPYSVIVILIRHRL